MPEMKTFTVDNTTYEIVDESARTRLDEVENTTKQMDNFAGTVEITGDTPTKSGTVLVVDPTAEEVNIYTAEEVDDKLKNVSGVEYGSNDNGEYYKFADGTLICTKKKLWSGIACSKAWSIFYETGHLELGDWPYSFISRPVVNATNVRQMAGFISMIGDISATNAGYVVIVRGDSISSATFEVYVTAIGRWK